MRIPARTILVEPQTYFLYNRGKVNNTIIHECIHWDTIEEKYAGLFPSRTGMPAKPLRMALGLLMIQKQYGYSDRELLEQITENPYY